MIPLFEAGEADGVLFLAMRYVSGTDLRALISEQGGIDVARAVRIVDGTAGALDAAHERGLVHRDVKPANILMTTQGVHEHVYLTDFGLTKQIGSAAQMTQTGQWVGTIDYVAPEQIEGKRTDARTDVYALGCVLFEALTGQIPFARDSHTAKLFAHVSEPPPRVTDLRPEVPEAIDDVVQRAMAKQPEDRYPSAGDLGRAARSAVTGEPISRPERTVARGAARSGEGDTPARAGTTIPVGGSSSGRKPGRRRLLAGAGIGVVVIAAAVTAVLVLGGGGGSESPELTRLRAQADEICVVSRNDFTKAAATPIESKADRVAQSRELADISERALRQLRQLDPPPEVAVEFNSYLELRRKMAHQLRNAEQDAREDDLAAYRQAQERIDAGAQDRYDAARAVGLTFCSRSPSA